MCGGQKPGVQELVFYHVDFWDQTQGLMLTRSALRQLSYLSPQLKVDTRYFTNILTL